MVWEIKCLNMHFIYKRKKYPNQPDLYFQKNQRKIHNGYELANVFGIKYYDSLINKILYLIFKLVDYKKFALISKPSFECLIF